MDPEIAAHPRPDFAARRRTQESRPARRSAAQREADRRARRNRLAFRLVLVAAVWSLGLLIAASVLPVYDGESISNASGVAFTTTTLVGSQGAWVLIPAAVPLLLCGVVWLALRRKRASADEPGARVAWVAIGLLGVFALLAILSIGAFVVPAVLLLARAAVLTTSPVAAAPRAPDRARPARPE
jgi:hypothetical protein